MGNSWTRERVLQAAPDAASAKAGEGLASTRKWVSVGHDDTAVWGECQGSGSKPYQVQALLVEAVFKCSCPSRKFPCKHGIGLMLLHAADTVPAGTPPDWVRQWIESRAQREAKKTEPPADLSPEKIAQRARAQETRKAKRLDNVINAMDDLGRWLEDLTRAGLAAAPTRGYAFFEERARRLVDGQAPGAARMVRDLASAVSSGEGWQARTLQAAALTHLLTVAARQIEVLPVELRDDIASAIGLPVPRETLDAAPAVDDLWQVLGREFEIEANLKSQKTYLYGIKTRRPAVLLDFAFGSAGLEASAPLGSIFPAGLVFYPGHSLRAAVRATSHDSAPLQRLDGLESFAPMLDAHADLLALNPWLGGAAFAVLDVIPTLSNGNWWVIDKTGDALPMQVRGQTGWTALAAAGGRPVAMGLFTDGQAVKPLSIVTGNAFIDLSPSLEDALR